MSEIDLLSSLRKHTPLRGYAVSRVDLRELYQLLQGLADEAAELEVKDYQIRNDQTPQQFEDNKTLIRSLFKVFVRIETESGATVSQTNEEIFTDPNIPKKISRIEYFSGHVFQQRTKIESMNQAYLLLDFRTGSSTGFNVQPAQETPNDSQFIVVGANVNWVRAATSKLDDFFNDKKRKGMSIHNAGIYDLMLMTLGILFVAWSLNFSVPHIDKVFLGYSQIYNYSGYIFVFLLSLRVFMFLFDYARLMWPVMELKENFPPRIIHRWIWGTLSIGIIAGILKDLLF